MVSSSVFLTAAVAMVLGTALGVVGVAAVSNQLSPNAGTVVNQQANQKDKPVSQPQFYGNR